MLLAMTVSKKMLIRQDRSFVFMLAVILVLLFADSFHKAQLSSTLGQWLCHAGTYIVFAADPVGYLSALVYIDSWTAGTKDHPISSLRQILLAICLPWSILIPGRQAQRIMLKSFSILL